MGYAPHETSGAEQVPRKFSKRIERVAAAQVARETRAALQRRADLARDKFRPRKSDRGRIIFVGVNGQRDPNRKGRKGYLVYVTTQGHKQLVYVRTREGERRVPAPRKISAVEIPFTRRLAKASKTFEQSRTVFTAGKPQTLQKGGARAETRAGLRFNKGSRTVNKLSRDLGRVFKRHAGHRVYNIRIEAGIRLPDGRLHRIEFETGIAKADRIAVAKGGLDNFVTRKVYAAMARQLAFLGYVTAGSANHVRRLAENEGSEQSEWTQHGEDWGGQDLEIVWLESIHWEIDQAKVD